MSPTTRSTRCATPWRAVRRKPPTKIEDAAIPATPQQPLALRVRLCDGEAMKTIELGLTLTPKHQSLALRDSVVAPFLKAYNKKLSTRALIPDDVASIMVGETRICSSMTAINVLDANPKGVGLEPLRLELIPRSRHSSANDGGVAEPLGAYTVNVPQVSVYPMPSADSHPTSRVPHGEVLEADEAKGEWVRLSVRQHGSSAGWVRAQDLKKATGRKAVVKLVDALLAGGVPLITVVTRQRYIDQHMRADDGSPRGDTAVADNGGITPHRHLLSGSACISDNDELEQSRLMASAQAAERQGASLLQLALGKAGAAATAGLAAARDVLAEGLQSLSRVPPGAYSATLAGRLCGNLAYVHEQRKEWWQAMTAAESALRGSAGRDIDVAVLCFARHRRAVASAELGMLTQAYTDIQSLEGSVRGEPAQAVAQLRSEVEARLSAIASGDGLAAELALLGRNFSDREGLGDHALISEKEVPRVLEVIMKLAKSPQGRAALHHDGMLDDDAVPPGGEAGLRRAAQRAAYRHVLYHANEMVHEVMVSRVRTHKALVSPLNFCMAPQKLHDPSAPTLLGPDALETLRRERLVVVDDALPAATIAAAVMEAEGMAKDGDLWADNGDLCAPQTARHNLLLHEGRVSEVERAKHPALAACVEAMCSTPEVLRKTLGLSLRVPQTVMVTAMPPGAAYREHLDGNGRDNPRLITVLLYLSPQVAGGALRVHVPGGSRDIYPKAGRVITFFAREVVHAVMPSVGNRFAMTLWIWSTDTDEAGR